MGEKMRSRVQKKGTASPTDQTEMSFFNYIPGVAHIKAGIHLICNDKEGAEKTMDTFHTKTPIVSHLVAGIAKVAGDDELAKKAWDGGNSSLNALPVVGHVKGLGHYVCGDIKGGNQAMKDATVTTSNIADGIPVVGHVKGVLHYAIGDVDGGNKAMKASTRTTAVMAAGAGGFVVGGPVGAVAGGVTAGSGWDVTTAIVTDGKEANGIVKIIQNPTSVDSYFDAGLSIVGDGFAGHTGGKIAEEAMNSGNSGGEIVGEDNDSYHSDKECASGISEEQNKECESGISEEQNKECESRISEEQNKECESGISEEQNKECASGISEEQNAEADKLANDFYEKKITYEELQQKWDVIKSKEVPVKGDLAEKLKNYLEIEWDEMKPKEVPVKVNPQKLELFLEKELVTEILYSQAMREMSNTGSKETTVVVDSPSGRKSSDNTKEQTQKVNKDNDNNNKDKQPPQQPTNTKKTCADEARILLLRQRLKEVLDRIRQHREQDPMRLDRQFQIESFHEIFNIVSELISNGHTLSINSDRFTLVISSHDDSWREEIEYQIIDDLNVHGQLTHQRGFPRNPGARCQPGGRILCCGFLVAQFQQGSQLVLSPQENYTGRPNIYGVRCRLCHNGGLACRISYVGLTERSAHARLCGEHARAARDLINQRANEEEPEDRPMYEHVALHLENGDLPEGTVPRDAFREVLDIILLPISGGPDELRSWEAFWQFFFRCRKFFWGWSQR